jgi:hypothetical protein
MCKLILINSCSLSQRDIIASGMGTLSHSLTKRPYNRPKLIPVEFYAHTTQSQGPDLQPSEIRNHHSLPPL